MSDSNNRSSHILNASSNLLGLCFLVLTSISVLKLSDASIIDECTAVAVIMFMVSCILSFLSLRSKKRSTRYENIADVFFITGLFCMLATTLLVVSGVVK